MANDPRPVNTGFDPEFGAPLRRFRAALAAQGIQTNIISGVRSPQEHQMAYDNWLAGQQGRPLPHPDFGPVSRATPPGATSTHDVGLGADIQPVNRADLPRMYAMAPKFGLASQGPGDPYHFNLANWQQTAANQPASTPWPGSPNQPTRYAQNISAAALPPSATGTTVNSTGPARPGSGFISSLINIESGGRSIANTHKGTSSGQAQGYAQITTGTWKDFAPRAGVDLDQYPNPMTDKDGNPVPYDVQMKVASIIPMGRWDPITLNKLTAQGFKIDTSKTLAENAALNGTSIPSAPAAPVVASGATGTAAGAPPAGAGGFKTQADADAFQKNLSNLDKTMGGKGLGQDQSQGQSQGGPPDIPASPMVGPPSSAQNVSPLLAMTPMTYGQTINSLQDPSTWYAPPGGRPQPRPQQGPMGTSLNSLAAIDPNMTPFPQSPIQPMGYMGYGYPGGGMSYG